MLTVDSIPSYSASAIGRVLDKEAVVVVPARGKVNVLNEVGARVWSLCDGKHTIRAIAAVICREYAVDEAQAEEDVLEFVQDLVTRGMLVVA